MVTVPSFAPALRRLYLVRFGFALVWAALLLVTAAALGPESVTLLVLYPLFDVAAAVVDARSSRAPALYANIAISSLAAAGLAVAAASGIPAVLRVWGTWAVVSGVGQLLVGLDRRRGLGSRGLGGRGLGGRGLGSRRLGGHRLGGQRLGGHRLGGHRLSGHRLGGQWPMILSGGISVLAGGSFILQAVRDGASLRGLAGYALLGGIFFLISALRMGRPAGGR